MFEEMMNEAIIQSLLE